MPSAPELNKVCKGARTLDASDNRQANQTAKAIEAEAVNREQTITGLRPTSSEP
ncbi:hypothetical protein POX_b02821 [Penicillium oxalicum]|uniref:hypothetical protein n=1 Tax=Penicillium oxalicum TaxID=69781 RepID=UPI0020B7F03D|nr:hypothetical protein POX_b02821 [Penicillium oxalicum]KAI2792778.1 hypothetical protein POX_b02821 [Penicillium oxalicum]